MVTDVPSSDVGPLMPLKSALDHEREWAARFDP
jgi:hypothetical protein